MMRFLRLLSTKQWLILSVGASLYFLWVFHLHVGFPPSNPLTPTSVVYLALFVLFLLAPFVQRFRLGRLIEFDAKVEEVRSDMEDVRTETRELISTVSRCCNRYFHIRQPKHCPEFPLAPNGRGPPVKRCRQRSATPQSRSDRRTRFGSTWI